MSKISSTLRCTTLGIALITLIFIPAHAQNNANPEPLRIAIAGLTHGHVNWILKRGPDPLIDIVGIFEPNAEVAQKYAKKYNFGMSLVYNDLDVMLDKVKPEAIAGFNPISEHVDIVRSAAPRGVHIMVEKPLATNMKDALEMEKLAKEHHVMLITNYETTWYETTQRVFELAHEDQALGPIRKIVVHDGHPGPQEIGVQEEFLEWLTDPAKNGAGALTDFGCYGANLATWLLKGQRPVTVTALTQQIKPDIYPNVDDEATIILTYPETQVIIQASWNWPHNRKDWEVYGTQAYVRTVDKELMYLIQDGDSEIKLTLEDIPSPYNDPFTNLRALVKGEIDPVENDLGSLSINMIVVEILDAAIKSAEENRTIQLSP